MMDESNYGAHVQIFSLAQCLDAGEICMVYTLRIRTPTEMPSCSTAGF